MKATWDRSADRQFDTIQLPFHLTRNNGPLTENVTSSLAQEFENLASILNHVVVPVLILVNNRILYANIEALNLFNLSRLNELTEADFLEFVAHPDRSFVSVHLENSFRNDFQHDSCETVLLGVDGYKPCQLSFKKFSINGTHFVIITIKSLPDNTMIHTDWLTSAINQMHGGFAVLDMQGKIMFVNQYFAELHGYTIDELKGTEILKLYPCNELVRLAAADLETMSSGYYFDEFIHARKDGSRFPCSKMSTVISEDGIPKYILINVRDIIERKLANEILMSQSNSQLAKIEEKHEILLRDLDCARQETETLSKRLDATFHALTAALEQLGTNKKNSEEKVFNNLRSHIFPLLDKLKTQKIPDGVLPLLDALDFQLRSLCSSFGTSFQAQTEILTPQEIHICELIRSGLSSKQIADVVGVSPMTVSTHRYHIRKKLGLAGEKENLESYIKSRS